MIRYKQCSGNSQALVHTCDPCDSAELGRVRSLVLINPGTTITIPFDLNQWKQGIEAGTIIIIPKTIGSFDGGSPVYGNGYGDETERKLADEYVLSVKDPAYKQNVDFWSAAEKETWNIAYRSESLLNYVKANVKLTAKAPIEEDLASEVVWNVELKWKHKDKPKVSDVAPIEQLFKCFDVVDESSQSSASSSPEAEGTEE